jgi:hypothetical protein
VSAAATSRKPWDIAQTGAAEWEVTLDGRPVQTITNEQVARVLEAALGIRVLRHAANDVEWRLGRDVWQCTDRDGVTEVKPTTGRDQMAAAMLACGFREVR